MYSLDLADIGMQEIVDSVLSQPFFHFHAVLAKIMRNDRLAPPGVSNSPQEILDPPD